MTMKLLADLPRRFQALMAPIMDTADAAFAVSLDCQILAWGTRAQQLFGFAPLEILGRYCYDTLPAHDAAGQCLCSVNCPMVVAARTGYSVGASEARICTKQKRWVWVRVSPVILREPQGTATAILVVASDVTLFSSDDRADRAGRARHVVWCEIRRWFDDRRGPLAHGLDPWGR